MSHDNEIRPFSLNTAEDTLDDLRRRIGATRWPSPELVTDRSQGVQLATMQGGQAPPPVRVPVGFTTFPGELWAAPRSWAEAVYPGLAYFHEADRGGHFAAWEEPELFAAELRAAFRPLRHA